MTKRVFVLTTVCTTMFLCTAITAYAGSWQQDASKPAVSSGVSNRWWRNDDGSYPQGVWAWIDGEGDGIAECYYFNDSGYLLVSTTFNDGTGTLTVDSNGAWTENGVVRIYPNQWVPGGNALTSTAGAAASQASLNPLDNGYRESEFTYSSISDAEAYNKLMQIKAELPEGTPWGNDSHYISGMRYGYGCAAFIFLVQDRLFGAPAKPRTVYNLNMSELRVGDHLRILDNTHSVIVLSNNGDSVTVCEGNYNHTIHWGRVITEAELRQGFVYRETCY